MYQRILTLKDYHELIQSFVLRDVKEKYQGTLLGYFWALLMPLPTMGVFILVFTYLLPVPIPHYPLYLLTGILVWNNFFVSLTDSTWSIRKGGELLRKAYLPPEAFPISSMMANLVTLCLSFVVLIPFLVGYQIPLTTRLLALPGIVLWQALFCCGLGMILALAHIYFRDTGPLVEAVLGMWFYATPIFYSTDVLSQKVRMIYYLNPAAVLVDLFRWSILAKPLPPLFHVCTCAILTAALLFFGVWLYKRHGTHLTRLL